MRVLITRPEREATALAAALAERGHSAVIAPLFALQILRPPADFAAALAACQAVLLSSANGARALAEAAEQRSKPILAVGDTTASTTEGLGFTDVVSASGDGAALAALVRQRLDPAKGGLVHVSGVDVAGEIAAEGFEIRRFALYEAREAGALPDSARAALQARALDVATFFSSRAAGLFARLVGDSGLAESCRAVSAVAISPAAAEPLKALPFKAITAAARPTRQAVLDEIDRLAEAVVQGPQAMSDTPSSTPPPPAPVTVKRGLGVFGAFVTGLVAAAIVLAGAVLSLPYWPEEARSMWRGPAKSAAADEAKQRQLAVEEAAKRQAEEASRRALEEASRARIQTTTAEMNRALTARIDDLEKRVRAAATTAAQADRPALNDAAIADLRAKIEALENRPAPPPAPAPNADTERELAALKGEIAALRVTLNDATTRNSGADQKALAAARASAVIGVAARLSAALEQGQPFAADLKLLAPLAQGDAKLTELAAALQPNAATGVAARASLATSFPAVAKAALADDLADDSFGERLLGKLKGLVSLRRVGADVAGDSVEAKLARAEAALDAGDLAKAVGLVKSLPPQTAKATAAWLARADAHLAAQRAVDQLAAHAVTLLGAAR